MIGGVAIPRDFFAVRLHASRGRQIELDCLLTAQTLRLARRFRMRGAEARQHHGVQRRDHGLIPGRYIVEFSGTLCRSQWLRHLDHFPDGAGTIHKYSR